MLLPARLHDGIRSGDVTVAFRRWKRPTVKAGGTLTTAVGELAIDAVDAISVRDITSEDARASGAASIDDLLHELRPGEDRVLYRIRFRRLGEDPRIALRESAELTDDDRAGITARLDRWDNSSPSGPWTRPVLDVIRRRPEVVSTELAAELGMERPKFKTRVRQLKSLGLTESLDRGYRLSPRGVSYLTGD